MNQHYESDINDIIDGSDEFDRDQQKLFDMFEAKFPINIDFHDDMEKTISGYPKEWTNITTNKCNPDDRSLVILTGKANNLTVIDIDVIKPKDGNKYDNYKKDEYGLGLFLKIMKVSSLEALASCTACHIIKSTSGGYHIYTEYLENLPSGNNVLPKIDIKNDKAGIIFTSKHEVISLSRDPSGRIDDYITKEVQKVISVSKAYKHYEKNKQFIKISLDHVKNMLDSLDKDRANNYDDWLNIGIILNNEFGDEAFELFNDFSKSSKKYKSETELRKFWYGLKQRTEGNRLSIGSLFHYIKSDSPSKYKKLSDEYFDSIKIDFSMEIPENKKAYYMDYKTRKEWVFNQDLLIYLKQRIYYYEKNENVWYVRDYDSVADQYSYLQIQDSKLYNTNIYVETVTGRMKLKTLIDLCLKLYLTVDEISSIPYNNLYPSPKNILNLYIDNNDKYYDPSLEIDNNLIESFLYHLREIMTNGNKEAYEYLLNWTAHKIQKPHKKIKTAIVFVSEAMGAGKSIYTDILNSLTGDNLVSTNIDKLMGMFNAAFSRKTVVLLEELKKGLSNDTCDFIKDFVTMNRITENQKFQVPINIHHYGDLIICSNNEHTIKVHETDRRYFITRISSKKVKDLAYFNNIAEYQDYTSDKFKHLYNYFMRVDISKFLPQIIPTTDFKKDLIEEQKSPVVQFVEYTNTQYLIIDKSFEATDTPNLDKVDKISAINLYQRYTAFCKENGITFILSNTSFGGVIKKYYKCTRSSKGITYSVRYIPDGINIPDELETPEE
jgi:hypothetical protein